MVVNFTDASAGNPSSWRWDLGNGVTSLLQNPSVTYFNPGQYAIKLVVKNSLGSDSIIKTQFIKVYASPQINFSGDIQSGCIPLTTNFLDMTIPGSGNIANWKWDFGDGQFSTIQNSKHTYTAAGNYNVSLQATNNFGCVSSLTKAEFIRVNPAVKAGFTNTEPAVCNKPATIQFSNTSTGSGALSYQWDFGDGASSILQNPAHTYDIGTYTVKLIVFNSNGCSDTITRPGLIALQKMKADFSASSIVCQSGNVNFLNTSSPIPSAADWSFGDGTFSTSINPVKIFGTPGNYSVKMIAGFGACKDSVIKSIGVIAKPSVDFTADATVSCNAPFSVNFSSTTGADNTFSWNFGDGTYSNIPNPLHTYLKEGFYSVTLKVNNNAGCTDSVIKTDFIRIKSPVALINNLPQKGCGPLSHTFSANINSIDSVVNYNWDFGDSTSSSEASPTHIYTKAGAYSVRLVYTTSSGCSDTTTFLNGILVGSKPAIKFSASPRNVCASEKVYFSDLSAGNTDQWLWQFGDGSSSYAQNPEHQYGDSGYFSVTLIAFNNGCADTLILPKYVHINAPIARFTHANSCAKPGHVVFTDKSIAADSWQWNFGDGISSSVQSPVHDYAVSGQYMVTLTVKNNTTGCDYTTIDTVTILKETADFTSGVTSVCKNTPVSFNAVNSNPVNIASYTWQFGDGTIITGAGNSINHTYKSSGNYDVTMILKIKNGCIDSISKPFAMHVDGPTAVFRSINHGACENTDIIFIDSSYTDGSHAIHEWQWNWGDGITQISTAPFHHFYNTPGNLSVSLKVTDDSGCADSVIHINSVVISKPVAAFKSDTLSCTLGGVFFQSLSTGPGLTYLWDFGDGSTSNQLNPLHNYTNEGVYTITLSVTDIYGCSDFISKVDYIRIANPKADFIVSDTIGNCPPLIVNFTNTSKNYTGFIWDFGDGTKSSSLNPSHFYATPGVFNAKLIINGAEGCTDEKTIQIKVKGPVGSFNYTNISGCMPLKTYFNARAERDVSFVWDFSDGTTIATPDSSVLHVYKTAGTYLPKMILIDSIGCKVPVLGRDSIKVYQVFASFTNPLATFCDSAKVKFTNTSSGNDAIANYLWNFGDNTTSVLADPSHSYPKTGIYQAKLVIISKNGCTDSIAASNMIKIVNSPKIAISGDAGACTPALLTFRGIISRQDTSALKWNWDFNNGNASTLQNPPSQTFKNAGSYPVHAVAINSSGCTDTAIKIAEAYPLPDLQISPDTTLCVGSSFVLKAKDAQTYSWSPGTYLSCSTCATPTARPDSAIKYFVRGRSNMGCFSSDSVYVDVKFPNIVKTNGADTLCAGSSVQLNAVGAERYQWFPATGLNDPNVASPFASPNTTTTYKVTGSDSKGCFSSTAYVTVKVYPLPVVSVGEDETINVGKSVDIVPQISPDVTGILWTPSTGIIARNYRGITVQPSESTEYSILVKNEGGCFARDNISVYVTCDNSNVFVPNTFSPNGDGVNDIFYPRGSGVFRVKNLIIFNRWGQVVYQKGNFNANDASAGWDGTYKGQTLSADVFVYTLEVLCANNQSLVFKGNVSLIK